MSFLYWSLRRLLELVVLRFRSEREKELEILLRHQRKQHSIVRLERRPLDLPAKNRANIALPRS